MRVFLGSKTSQDLDRVENQVKSKTFRSWDELKSEDFESLDCDPDLEQLGPTQDKNLTPLSPYQYQDFQAPGPSQNQIFEEPKPSKDHNVEIWVKTKTLKDLGWVKRSQDQVKYQDFEKTKNFKTRDQIEAKNLVAESES